MKEEKETVEGRRKRRNVWERKDKKKYWSSLNQIRCTQLGIIKESVRTDELYWFALRFSRPK